MREKSIDCDREAARLLQIQIGTGRTRLADRALIIAFAAFLGAFALLFWLLPDRAFSETENRTLRERPAFSWKALADGSFAAEFAEYMADQFPARDFFVNLKAASETALGRGGNNGVIFGRDGVLAAREDAPNLANLDTNLAAAAHFAARCGVPATFAVAGRTMDVLDGALPAIYGSECADEFWNTLHEKSAAAGLALINLRAPLRARAAAGEYVCYRTDHHWTTLGAYYGAAGILAAMGKTAAPLADYTRETASDAFYGTTWSTAGADWIAPDTLEFFRFAGDGDFTVAVADDGSSMAGFYDRSYLEKKDKYSAFLGGNHALVTVTKPGETRETLLIVKDSFAHAAAPFLAREYDLVLVDARYYHRRIADLIGEYGVDRVLFLVNADSLTASAVWRVLDAGLD